MTVDGLRDACGLLTVLPVRVGRLDRRAAGRAIAWAPLVGLLLGAAAAAPLFVVQLLAGGPLLAAAMAVTVLAAGTRGLHLDGLADLADGLGSGRPAPEALRVMRSPDIGPFGVATVVLALLIQVAALAQAAEDRRGLAALLTAAVAGRLTVVWACRGGVPSARSDGLGALVAGSVRRPVAAGLVVAGLVAAAAAGAAPAIAMAAGLVAAAMLQRHAVRRLGGLTGDVLGALVETAATVTLVVMAVGPLA